LLLSFSLLHAGPAAAVFDWQFDQFEQQYLAPLQQALAPVAGVSVESQVAFFTRAKVNGSWSSSHDAWVVQSADLPFFVDSDWPVEAAGIDMAAGRPDVTHAHSSATRGVGAAARPGVSSSTAAEAGAHGAHAGSAASVPAHVLHFLVYIPPPEQQPLLLLDAAGQPSAGNSMWLPSWGGLLVVNPPVKRQGDRTALSSADDTSPDINSSSGTEHRPQPGSAWPPSPQQLRRHQQQHIARVVAGQLQALFGLVPAAASHTSHTRGSSSSNMSVQQLDPLSTGLSDWQVDQLVTQAVASQVGHTADMHEGNYASDCCLNVLCNKGGVDRCEHFGITPWAWQ
jgi:phosphatidylinositol glycan class S